MRSLPKPRRFLLLLLVGVFVLSFGRFTTPKKAQAISFPAGHFDVKVGASIGEFYISLSGFIAPYASVVLTTDSVVMRSTAADSAGYFSISQVLIKQGFDHFCLHAVDVKRLGESEACFHINPATGDVIKNNIFLPPTIGLFRTQVQVGNDAIIWGYSMPGAKVTVHSSDGKDYTATADSTGFYKITTKIQKAGNYDLYATGEYRKQNSEQPTNKVTLEALTLAQSTNETISNWLKNLLTFLFNIPLGPLWLAIPIIILIYILWRKLQGKPLVPSIDLGRDKMYFDYLLRPRKLHHHWMKGVGY